MTNIWDFLLQTMEVSLTAVLLLLVKRLFADKLSPRWQYGVWILLAAKLLLPARLMGRYFSATLAAALETCKSSAEAGLASAYSDQWIPVGGASSVIPYAAKAPVSITDWLFILYMAGVAACFLWYGQNYARLRLILRHGEEADSALQEKIQHVCLRYGLTPCRAVIAEGIPSAFVCGCFRPVLVIPAAAGDAQKIDDKILLHELMHKTCGDTLQNVLWYLMRALHWCNPFLQYVFNHIGNDMESLCDQRVLERLAGEERREYGKILLSMTDEKYARTPGTTSLSNGGRNIARRIEAIAQFKKYPKGMALASVCILILLTTPVLAGSELDGYSKDYPELSGFSSQFAMAQARMNRCTTQAGAIDTWVKGSVFGMPAYLAAVTPYSQQEKLKTGDFALDIAEELQGQQFSDYVVYNLHKESEGCYTALAVLEGEPETDDGDTDMRALAAVPLTLRDERGWTAVQSGEILHSQLPNGLSTYWGTRRLPYVCVSEAESKNGVVTIAEQTIGIIQNEAVPERDMIDEIFNIGAYFDRNAKRSAKFSEEKRMIWSEYRDCRNEEKRQGMKSIGIIVAALEQLNDKVEWDFSEMELETELSGSSSTGQGFVSQVLKKGWNGKLDSLEFNIEDFGDIEGFAVRIFENGRQSDALTIKRGAKL